MNLSHHVGPLGEFEMKIWIWLGVFVCLLLLIIPVALLNMTLREGVRFRECQAQIRNDCTPSAFWILNGWDQTGEGTTSQLGLYTTGTVATSSTGQTVPVLGPTISSATVLEATYDAGRYRFPVDHTATVSVRALQAVSIHLYRRAEVSKTATLLGELKLDAASGEYRLRVTLPAGFSGKLEIRAEDKEKRLTTLMLDVAS